MPCVYDDVPGSWGEQSKGWPSTPYTMGKWLLCTKANVVPYGSYVVIQPHYPKNDGAYIRVETSEMLAKLEAVYKGMFLDCRKMLLDEEFRRSEERVNGA